MGDLQLIENIYLRDMNGTDDITISVGEPGNWTAVAEDNCGRYKTWSYHVMNTESRYVRITKHGPSANISEVVLYVKE
jgi:hypothetical protein